MAKISCLPAIFLCRIKKKKKASSGNVVQAKMEQKIQPIEADGLKPTGLNVAVSSGNRNFMSNCRIMNHESPVKVEATEKAYEGEDEHEENLVKHNLSDFDEEHSIKRNVSDFEFCHSYDNTNMSDYCKQQPEEDALKEIDIIRSGHVSDPGIEKARIWASPKLKHCCSNLETSNVLRMIADELPPPKSQSFEELQKLAEKVNKDLAPCSPLSVFTHCSADKVMLKKHSSSQILPSRSRRLWWKLFLWSHRNLNQSWSFERTQPRPSALNQQGGYSSDTLERAIGSNKLESPGSFTGESFIGLSKPESPGSFTLNTNCRSDDNERLDGLKNRISGLWPQNQWIAFPGESSSYSRVDEWVKDLEDLPPAPAVDDEITEENIYFPPSPARSVADLNQNPIKNLSVATLHANSVIQSLNSSATVAHISGIGLKVIPTISHFLSLKSVNLSSNYIAHITPGSLPKGLHTLNLSRNKISSIEGLRELTRLRVLDLSYNRITRIGQGLSNCTLIKELYLAGNKISDVEGLHRLLKLTILDLSFNKITRTKALGQLVANYSSLLALNLLGNPIQSNMSDDQLRKTVCGILPKLIYLNKQPTKPQRGREVLKDSVAKAALRNSSTGHRGRAGKRANPGLSHPSSGHRSNASVGQRSKYRSRSRADHQLPQRTVKNCS